MALCPGCSVRDQQITLGMCILCYAKTPGHSCSYAYRMGSREKCCKEYKARKQKEWRNDTEGRFK